MNVTNQEVMNVTSYSFETVSLSKTKPVCEHDGCLKFATKLTDGGDGKGAIKVCGMHTRERINKRAEKKRACEEQAKEKERVKMQKTMEKTTDTRKVADRLFDDECPICLGGDMWKYASQGIMSKKIKDALKPTEEEEKPVVLKPQPQRIGQVMVLPCKHLLHTECMNKMIRQGRHSCPLCSKEFRLRYHGTGQDPPRTLELSNDIILMFKGEKADLMRETVNSIRQVVNNMTTEIDTYETFSHTVNEMTIEEWDGVGAIMA